MVSVFDSSVGIGLAVVVVPLRDRSCVNKGIKESKFVGTNGDTNRAGNGGADEKRIK